MNSSDRNCSGKNMEDAHTDKKIQEKRIGNEERLREKFKAMGPTENNSHVYDNVFKTMGVRVPKWNIPMVLKTLS